MVSVGTGTLDSALSRFLIRRVLGTAQYRSFRDEGSRELVRNVGFFRSDPVYPDLAYGLPASRALETGRGGRDRKMRIAISPMAYARPSTWPVKDAARYAQYVRKLADLAVALLEGGYELHLIYSDSPDKRVVSDLYTTIDAQFGGNQKLNIEMPSTDDVELFLTECRSADLVIASRLHSVVLSHVAGTPVLALSYDRKVRAAMMAANQMSNCLDIDAFNVEEALVKVESILSAREQHREAIEAHVQASRSELTAQYDQIFPRNMSVCLS